MLDLLSIFCIDFLMQSLLLQVSFHKFTFLSEYIYNPYKYGRKFEN